LIEIANTKSSYENFSIPPEIEARGAKEKERFREFAEENKKVLHEDQERFLSMLEARFLLSNRPQKVAFDNSGVVEFSKLKLEEMEKEIDSLLVEAHGFLIENPHVERLKYSSKLPKTNGVTDEDEIWHGNYKRKLKAMLRSYIVKNYNPGLEYSIPLLESLGFERCAACAEEIKLGF